MRPRNIAPCWALGDWGILMDDDVSGNASEQAANGSEDDPKLVPLFRYLNGNRPVYDHFYTTNFLELGYAYPIPTFPHALSEGPEKPPATFAPGPPEKPPATFEIRPDEEG